MQISEIKSEKTSREYKVVLKKTKFEGFINDELKEIQKSSNIPGFRKGKTPLNIIDQKYGKNALAKTINKTVDDSLQKIIKDNNFQLASQPNVNIVKANRGDDFEFEFQMELMPDFEIAKLEELSLTKYSVKIASKDIDEAIEKIAGNNKDFNEVKRKSKLKDQVVFDFEGSIDGKLFDGGASKDHSLELGSNQFIPGFEEQLVGLKSGDEKDVKVTFPKDYQAKDLAGKEAVFKCKIHKVNEGKEAIIDDELAKKLGMKDLAGLKDAVLKQLQSSHEPKSRAILKNKIMEELSNKHKFELSEKLIKTEFDPIWEKINKMIEANSLEDVDKGKTEEELKTEYWDIAERRLRLGLILAKYSEEKKLEVSDNDVNQAIFAEARRFPGQEMKVFEYYQKNPKLKNNLKGPLLEEKAIDTIIAGAKISEKEILEKELQKALEDSENVLSLNQRKKSKPKKTVAKSNSKKKEAKKTLAK